jgi:hypothetical protein
VEVDEEERHRVEKAIAIAVRARRESHEEAPVLERVSEVLGRKDRGRAVRCLRDPRRADGRQAGRLQPEKDLVLAAADRERQLLERIECAVDRQEADEMPRRPDGQLPEREGPGGPVAERLLPRQLYEGDRRIAKTEAGERRRGPSVALLDDPQSRFRR